MQSLVIVESPVKAKTISGFLAKNYKVESSFGHVRDLPSSVLGVDIENGFLPKYVVPPKAKPKVKILKNETAKAKEVILATDEDREGEAIAWHLSEVLKLKNPKRIVFHEITKPAIEQALQNPRAIDLNLVNSQQARRILDRLVGYKLSPFLWKKLMRGLSAGRVQSVAVRLICDRENEINDFKPQEYWTVEALLQQMQNENSKCKNEFRALLVKQDGKLIDKLEIKNKEQADKILQDLQGAKYVVENVEKKEIKRNPLAPFTTSTLQQEGFARLRLSAKFTMKLAQDLYEKGFITYHRTDSLNLSQASQASAQKFIIDSFGKNYWPGAFRMFKTKAKSAQEAHEAIRPTSVNRVPDDLVNSLEPKQLKIYRLIWQRFLASQMSSAVFNTCCVDISANFTPAPNFGAGARYIFRANGQTLKFDGFLKVYPAKFQEMDLPLLESKEVLELKELVPSQHFTQPPSRYSEATLIKKLEQEGIGRPSTYAPILDTVQKRNYVEKDENKKLKPTQTGVMVNEMLAKHFPQIVDIQFTAKMEKELDEITEGKDTFQKTLKDFYVPFEKNLKEKETGVAKKDLTEKTDKICPQCQSPMIIRLGRFGKFLACSKFPNCKHTENLPKPSLNIECPKCGQGELMERTTKKRKIFYGCSLWPKCDFALWDKPQNQFCPRCKSIMVENKRKKIVCSSKQCLNEARIKKIKKKI